MAYEESPPTQRPLLNYKTVGDFQKQRALFWFAQLHDKEAQKT
jgi:hypothetical protein